MTDQDPTAPEESGESRAVDPAMAALARARSIVRKRPWQVRGQIRPTTMSSAAPDSRDPQLLAASMNSWLRENNYQSELSVAGLVGRWTEIVGEQMAQHVQIAEFYPNDRRVLLVADSQEWAMQVRYLIRQVQRRIDEELGPDVVTDISVQGPGGKRAGGSWRVRTGRRSPR